MPDTDPHSAPDVAALRKLCDAAEAQYIRECQCVSAHNNSDGVGQAYEYMSEPVRPEWIDPVRSLLDRVDALLAGRDAAVIALRKLLAEATHSDEPVFNDGGVAVGCNIEAVCCGRSRNGYDCCMEPEPEQRPFKILEGAPADVELYCAARNVLPLLLDTVDALTTERDKLREDGLWLSCEREDAQLARDAAEAEAAQLRATVETLRAPLVWLMHLHHGMSKGGPDVPITDDEWSAALEQARTALDPPQPSAPAPRAAHGKGEEVQP